VERARDCCERDEQRGPLQLPFDFQRNALRFAAHGYRDYRFPLLVLAWSRYADAGDESKAIQRERQLVFAAIAAFMTCAVLAPVLLALLLRFRRANRNHVSGNLRLRPEPSGAGCRRGALLVGSGPGGMAQSDLPAGEVIEVRLKDGETTPLVERTGATVCGRLSFGSMRAAPRAVLFLADATVE
jgi:hypothetical protein